MTTQQTAAINALKHAAEEFDQAHAALRDAGLHLDGAEPLARRPVTATDINWYLPKLIAHLEELAEEEIAQADAEYDRIRNEQCDADPNGGCGSYSW